MWNPHLTDPDGLTLPTPDGLIAEARIALEVDSREHHAASDGWRRTLERHNVLTEHGFTVLHFTPVEIRSESARVLRVIEQTYARRMRDIGTGR
jgi:very-short-patch-repair endonuclease